MTDFALVDAVRTGDGDGRSERVFLDFVIGSRPTYPTVLANGVDNITPIWRGGGEWCRDAVLRLLGDAEPDAPGGRVSVYVCAECADLGCGAITVVVERHAGTVTWREWGLQYDDRDDLIALADLPDVTFDATQYDAVLRRALDLVV